MSRSQANLAETVSSETGALRHSTLIGVEHDALLLGLLEQSGDCIKMLGLDGTLEYMNCGGLAAMEIDAFSMVGGKIWWELWPEDTRKLVRKKFETAAAGSEAEFIALCPTAKGNLRRWSVKLKPMIAVDSRVAGVLCTSRDISQKQDLT
ncbi:PAS domain-containing protein [uncultured Erythrobacter sp.]|uniref:PAS domain-containing protein n=1 Tax=uncultured Erythrobacter sp. TaxID=263913 RepID=UPI002623FB18|nr:PAS domain-containing protein [uncultured Erythrobacter sp.]